MLALSAISGIIAVFILITNYIPKRKKRALIIMSLSAMILLSSDRLAYIYRGNTSLLGYYIVRISNYLVYATSLSIIYGFNEILICFNIDNSKEARIPKLLIYTKYIILIGEVVLIISQFTNLYYYFDDNNYYQRGNGFALCYIFPLIAFIVQSIIILIYNKQIRKRIFIPLLLFAILPIVATIIQVFNYGISPRR